MRVGVGFGLACVLALGAAGCGVASPSSLINEPVFSDAVGKGGISNTMFFTTSKTGEFTAKVTALSPDSGVTLTALLGNPGPDATGTLACQVSSSAGAGFNKTFFDIQLPKGDYCLQMTDPTSSLPRTEFFTIAVAHS